MVQILWFVAAVCCIVDASAILQVQDGKILSSEGDAQRGEGEREEDHQNDWMNGSKVDVPAETQTSAHQYQ